MLLPLIRKQLPLFLIMVFVCAITASLGAALCSVYASFNENIQTYMTEYGFPDGFLKLKFDTTNALSKADLNEVVQTIDGIEQADLRWSTNINVTAPNQNCFICNIKNYDDTQFSKFYYHDLGLKSPTAYANVMVTREVAIANNLKVGSSLIIEITYQGSVQRVPVYVNGIVSRPETMRQEISRNVFVNREDFGYAFLPTDELSRLGDEYRDKGNEVVIKIKEGCSQKAMLDELIQKLKDKHYISVEQIDDYYTAEDSSTVALINESMIHYLSILCFVLPLAFAVIALVLISLFMYQIIHHLHREIGILNAIGNSKRSIFGLMAAFTSVIALLGSLIGILSAIPLSSWVYSIIHNTYCMPIEASPLHPIVCIVVVFAILVIALLSSLITTGRIQKLSPAEAVLNNREQQKPLPKRIEKIASKAQPRLIIGFNAIRKNLPRFLVATFTFFSVYVLLFVGLSLSVSTNVCTNQIDERINYDATIYQHDTNDDATKFYNEIKKLQTVNKFERSRLAGATFTFNDRSVRENILGLEPNHAFFKIPDANNQECPIMDDCIILDQTLADTLNAHINDIITVNGFSMRVNAISFICVQKRQVTSFATFDKLVNYDLKYNNCALATITDQSAFLKEAQTLSNATTLLEERGKINMKNNFIDVIYISSILEFFAVGIGFVTILTISLLALNEDKRKYCIMLMLGYRTRDVSMVAFIQTITSLILGIAIASGPAIVMSQVILNSISLSYVTFPFLNYWWVYLLCIGLIFAFSLIAHLISTISIKRTILAQYVNSRE